MSEYRTEKSSQINRKSLTLFYQIYERKEIRDLGNRAKKATEMWDGVQPIADLPRRSRNLIDNMLCYLLFGSVISFVSPLLIPILTIAPAVNWFCAKAYRNWEYSHREHWTDIDSKLWYVQEKTADFAAAKDIRIYGMAGWFRQIFRDFSAKRLFWEKKMILRSFLYRRYLDLEQPDGSGEAQAQDHLKTAPEITLDHVSFRYEESDKDTLHDISLTINPGEKVALVGLNGAGKTTLVKLLCGLYLPACGDIRINGISSRSFGREDYYRLFSPVFQDIQAGFFTLAEIVSGQIRNRTDSSAIQSAAGFDRAEECMRLAGLGEKLDTLPHGIHTHLDKQLYADGTELSGGELQKLMLARALCKNAPVLVLDEPTAALDPIAENQIYLQYRNMTQGKTSLFISHRLASTQFCDRILYLKDGTITEQGTHQELIALGGEYAWLYELQSCWYQPGYAAETPQ
ncbi:MAG: ATP-binding cassette domain-containing protein [Lachnospiraceae bacterium]|jgi:ABC-type multidrug transport system fused ATPase/permease subunit|nr:ATP-binding cassette domain-containing protein [Lachnospiraceae bacterium]